MEPVAQPSPRSSFGRSRVCLRPRARLFQGTRERDHNEGSLEATLFRAAGPTPTELHEKLRGVIFLATEIKGNKYMIENSVLCIAFEFILLVLLRFCSYLMFRFLVFFFYLFVCFFVLLVCFVSCFFIVFLFYVSFG